MLIIPAIDLINGQCVRLVQGDYDQKTVYNPDPVAVAREFTEAGAKLIHVVDLDGAKSGGPKNLPVIERIIAETGAQIELGGGIRDLATIEQVLSTGVARVILGTAALKNPPWLSQAVAEFGDRIVVGIDARNGLVAVEGWLETSTQSALDLAEQMKATGVQEIIYTDIARDGMLSGPNLEELAKMSQSGLRIVASGGVATIEDITKLKALEPMGVYAVIIGKALYTGAVNLAEALKIAGDE